MNMLSVLFELLVSYCHAHYNGCTANHFTLIAVSSGAECGAWHLSKCLILRLILNVSFSQSQSQIVITLIPVEMFKLSNIILCIHALIAM